MHLRPKLTFSGILTARSGSDVTMTRPVITAQSRYRRRPHASAEKMTPAPVNRTDPHNPLSIARLQTPTVQRRKPPEKRQRLTIAPVRSATPLAIPVARDSAPPAEPPPRPSTAAVFCKRTFLAKLDLFEPLPKAGLGMSYGNGRVLPSLHNILEPHMGVLYSVIRDGFVWNLFTQKEHELTDIAPLLPRAEQFYDLLSGESEISRMLRMNSAWVRAKAAATASAGEEAPLDRFLRTVPGLARADIEAVYLEDRRVVSERECENRVLGDCFPLITRPELGLRDCQAVESASGQEDAELKVGGFPELERLLG